MAEQNNNENRVQMQNATPQQEQAAAFSYKDVWNIVLLHWIWIVLGVVISLGCAFLYLRYQTPTFSASAKMLIKDDENQKKSSTSGLNLSEMGIISNTNGFDNELQILTSTSISNDVVRELQLNIRYYTQGRFTENELYKCAPITVSMSPDEMDALNTSVRMNFTPDGKAYHVKVEIATNNPDVPLVKELAVTKFPSSIKTSVGTFHFERNAEAGNFNSDLIVYINPIDIVGRTYANQLAAQATSKTTTVADLKIIDSQPRRAVDYLNQLMESYNADANADKNEVATKTKDFINERIEEIGLELSNTEKDLEQYKKQNELINLANDATSALESSSEYQKEQVEINTQLQMTKSLIDYVNKPSNDNQIIPANLGIKDALVNTQITKYNETLLQYNRLAKNGGENNPTVIKLAADLNDLHNSVAQSLRNIYSDQQVQKRSIDGQRALFSGRISNTPTQERILTDKGREQEIQASLYLTLLQKREENLISLASTATKAKWLDEPQINGKVSPKTSLIWLIALLLGIAFPIGIFVLIEFLRYRIEGRLDVETLTKIPLIADIPFTHMPKGQERAIVVSENCNNTMEESFRGLRTNMRFILGKDEKVIICTSTIPGEGKTFISSNLAMSYALLGKKVILVGLDIRKPQLVRLFDLPADKRGITTYLADEMAGPDVLEAQIHHGVINSNLDVMPAGIIPPNPGELISRERLDMAINYLRTKYDVILLDTPPLGLVSDTLDMGHVADTTIIVCRADYTPKTSFGLINSIKEENKLPKVSIVLNGVDFNKKKYGYYYGYGKYAKYGYRKYGKYGHYGSYSHYGNYGQYGKYGVNSATGKKSKNHTEK